MAVIARISNSSSAHASLAYAIGKGKNSLKNETKSWLTRVGIDATAINQRAVVMSGTNGVDPEIADIQFKVVRQAFNKDTNINQVLRVIQSFDESELTAAKKEDWQRANDLGRQLAKELYPNNQTAIYTHIDGEHHTLHNHIIINKIRLDTGNKLHEKPGEAVTKARLINDNIARQEGWHILEKPIENVSQAEKYFGTDSWRTEIKQAIDHIMTSGEATSIEVFTKKLSEAHIKFYERGKNLTFVISRDGQEKRVRGNKLGSDYMKETLYNELERQNKQARQRQSQSRERTTNAIKQQTQSREQTVSRAHHQLRTAITNINGFAARIPTQNDRSRTIIEQTSKTKLNNLTHFFSSFNQSVNEEREIAKKHQQYLKENQDDIDQSRGRDR